jgi:predicted phosphodiesterase
MRIIVTSDLHYNLARSKAPTRGLAREICELGGDILIFAGDSASTDLRVLDEVFGLFESFSGVRLAVAGNHELWTTGGADSLLRYENELAEVCSRNGVHYLDREPFRAGDLAVVGNVGWYDFTFRSSVLNVPLRFYQHKIAPGAAARLAEHRHLLGDNGDVPEALQQLGTRWMDGVRVKLPVSDIAFTATLAAKLRRHLEDVSESADRIIAAIHHLPLADLVPHSVIPNWEFATGFMGSELFGEVLLDFDKVSHVFCGHSHRRRRCQKTHLTCCSIGSTYREKQYEVLDI